MSTETDLTSLPSVETLSEHLYATTSASALVVAFDRLPSKSKREYHRLVREIQAVELRRMAWTIDYYSSISVGVDTHQTHALDAEACRRRANELDLIGGDE